MYAFSQRSFFDVIDTNPQIHSLAQSHIDGQHANLGGGDVSGGERKKDGWDVGKNGVAE